MAKNIEQTSPQCAFCKILQVAYMTLSFVVNNAKLFIIVTGNFKGNIGMITKQDVLPCKALITRI
jgi:hypothetical protein